MTKTWIFGLNNTERAEASLSSLFGIAEAKMTLLELLAQKAEKADWDSLRDLTERLIDKHSYDPSILPPVQQALDTLASQTHPAAAAEVVGGMLARLPERHVLKRSLQTMQGVFNTQQNAFDQLEKLSSDLVDAHNTDKEFEDFLEASLNKVAIENPVIAQQFLTIKLNNITADPVLGNAHALARPLNDLQRIISEKGKQPAAATPKQP